MCEESKGPFAEYVTDFREGEGLLKHYDRSREGGGGVERESYVTLFLVVENHSGAAH